MNTGRLQLLLFEATLMLQRQPMRIMKMIMMLRTLNLGLKQEIHSIMCILVLSKSNPPFIMLNKCIQRIQLSYTFEAVLKSHSTRSSVAVTALYNFKMLRDYQCQLMLLYAVIILVPDSLLTNLCIR
jgi:hypothetical protein